MSSTIDDNIHNTKIYEICSKTNEVFLQNICPTNRGHVIAKKNSQFAGFVLLSCHNWKYNLICKELIKLIRKKSANIYGIQVCDILQYIKGGEVNYAACFSISHILFFTKSSNCQPHILSNIHHNHMGTCLRNLKNLTRVE